MMEDSVLSARLTKPVRALRSLAALALCATLSAQTIDGPYAFSVLAGTPGTWGSQDGTTGTGPVALLSRPEGVAVDSGGNLYVADNGNGVIRMITPAGLVTTFAGTAGLTGSTDGIGSAARFAGVSGIAVDGLGNVYVTDQVNNTIRKITPQGSVTTLAGTPGRNGFADGTGSAAEFASPAGIAVDASGTLYVADTSYNTIRKITSDGVVTTFAGAADPNGGSADGTGLAAQFNEPFGVAIDAEGNLYVADQRNNAIRKITPGAVVTTLAGNPQGGSADGTGSAAEFDVPAGVAVDSAGNVFVADFDNNTIRKITPQGVVTTFAGTAGSGFTQDGTAPSAGFLRPLGIAVGSNGNVYVSDNLDDTVRKITPGQYVSTLAGVANTQGHANGVGPHAQFHLPFCVAFDPSGNLFVTDTQNYAVREISPSGDVTTFAGTLGTQGSADGAHGLFEGPGGVAADSGGNLYVSDTVAGTIRKIAPSGVVSTLAGKAGATGGSDGTGAAASFNQPGSLAVDSSGNVYVADTGNNTLRKVSPSGNVTTLAGVAGAAGSTDGTGSSARFDQPFGVAIDPAGNIFVGDINNNTIRKVTPAGVVTTFAGRAGVIGNADGSGTSALLNEPGGLAFDNAGNLIFADTSNGTIRRITPGGAVSTLAGTPGVMGSADSVGPLASFETPVGVAVDGNGNIYVADLYNETIRVGEPSLAPFIAAQPVSQAVASGGTAVFNVSCFGSPAPTLQWEHDGTPIPGATGAILVVSGAGSAAAGTYTCTVTNASGSVTTDPATLAFASTSNPGRLINISCRALSGVGASQLIAGFVVGGGGASESVLIRASGPALSPFGVTDFLTDPVLTLKGPGGIEKTNEGWGGNATVSSTASELGAFAWTSPSSSDSALIETLPAGAYTAQVAGANGDAGVALAEVYDATPAASYGAASPRLIDISARVQVGTGGNVLIAGFVIGGTTSKTVLIRASGPALSPFGVPGVLPDPKLTLSASGANGSSTLIASNEGWEGDQEIAATAAGVGAFSWGASATPDSAILVTLPPGAYTAQVAGSNGDSGVALVEVYDVP